MSKLADYIERTYGVPVKKGGRVEYTGDKVPQLGTITGTNGAYVMIRLDGKPRSLPYHPTWALRYIDEEPRP